MKLIRNQLQNLHSVSKMKVTFDIDDPKLWDLTKSVNVKFIIEKAFKDKILPDLVERVQHRRKCLTSYLCWLDKYNYDTQIKISKLVASTIEPDSFVPQDVQNRDLIIEAIEHYRA